MNRFKIVLGKEKEFEDVWKNRDTHLEGVSGFKEFHLVKGDTNDEHTLYASHSIWNSKNDFINWTKSEAFRLANLNASDLVQLIKSFFEFQILCEAYKVCSSFVSPLTK